MARISVFQGGSIQQQAPEVTPFRAPDFGPGIGPGVEKLGESMGEAAQKIDEIQDIDARAEANTVSVARSNLAREISQRVRSTLGESAEAAAEKGVADLRKGTDVLLSKASPRARRMVEPLFAERNGDLEGELWTHAFEQKKQAFDTSSEAANDHDLEDALHTDTEAAAKPYLDSIAARNKQRAAFFGLGSDWETQENLKAVSGYHKGRALALGTNDATAAVKYAIDHRGDMSADDYDSIIRAYNDEAVRDQGTMFVLRHGGVGTVSTQGDATGPQKRADPTTVFNALIIPNEGTRYLAHDSNGAPVRYGINQAENPGVDVSKLTQDGAQQIFINKYWKPSGAGDLSPALAAVHADTYYLNPSEAMKILHASGGDVDKYMELRDNFLASLHARNPSKYPDYTSRNERVANFAAMLGGESAPFSFSGRITPSTSMSAVTAEVMQRTDMPMKLKMAIIDAAREQRSTLREDKSIQEDNARDTLITAVTKLGDKFTSVKQLPPDALASASPETIESLTEHAKANLERKDDSALRPYVTMIQVTDPNRFVSTGFIQELMRKGASSSLISDVQTQQAEMAKKAMNAKPDVISDGTLWEVAKPAFEASGLPDLDATGKDPATGNKVDLKKNATEKVQAIVFLQKLASDWAIDNPGKRPTPDIMRQWVGAALLKTKSGSYAFQATDADIYNSLPDGVRSSIIRGFRRHGSTATGPELISDVASYYRKLRANFGTGPINLGPGGKIEGTQMTGTPVSSFDDILGDQ